MFSALLITLREGIEAALIVGIVLGYLRQVGRRDQMASAWVGIGAATTLSAFIAVIMRVIGAELEEPFEQIFEGTTMLLAVAVLTWMIFWMRYQGRFIKPNLEHHVESAVSGGVKFGIFGITFLAIFREGVETALFLAANAFAADTQGTVIGALLGIAFAIGIGVLIYAYAVRLNMRLFFDASSILLIIFAAGLAAHGIHEFQEIGWLPILTNPAWNTTWLLTNDSALGSMLRALLGYNAEPSLLEVATYVGYLIIIVQAIRWWTQKISLSLTQKRA